MIYNEWKDSDGSIKKVWGNKCGDRHREDGPAFISTYKDGTIRREEFWRRGERYNITGPAIICYDNDGSIFVEHYYLSVSRYLGSDKRGFWALWDILNEEERKHASILKLLARYS